MSNVEADSPVQVLSKHPEVIYWTSVAMESGIEGAEREELENRLWASVAGQYAGDQALKVCVLERAETDFLAQEIARRG